MPYKTAIIAAFALLASACSPEVGSPAWCEDMDAKPKGEWSTNEAVDYARHCLFENPPKD